MGDFFKQVEDAVAAGWRIFEQNGKLLAEKSVSLPGYTASLVREEADSAEELFARLAVRERFFGGDPNEPVRDTITDDGTLVTGSQHAAIKTTGVTVEPAPEQPLSAAYEENPNLEDELVGLRQNDVLTTEGQVPAGVVPAGEAPALAAADESSVTGSPDTPAPGDTVEPVEGVVVQEGDFVTAPGAGETEPVPSTEDLQPEDTNVVSGGAIAGGDVADTENVKADEGEPVEAAQTAPQTQEQTEVPEAQTEGSASEEDATADTQPPEGEHFTESSTAVTAPNEADTEPVASFDAAPAAEATPAASPPVVAPE